MRPQARRDGLVLRDLPEELLVYDTIQHRAHCLNRTAALVFRHANGGRTVADLALLALPGADPADGEEAVRMAVFGLGEAGLLEAGRPAASRREFVRKVGLGAAILLPAVVSILAPTPAEAVVSTCIDANVPGACASNLGQPCTCSGTCDPTDPSAICNGAGSTGCGHVTCPP